MAGDVFFLDVNNTPPGGLYFYETHGERVVGHTFLEIAPRVRALMEKYRIPGTAEGEVAAYMCPRIPNPGAYCRGTQVPAAHVRSHEAIVESLKYCRRRVVSFDKVSRRLRVCAECPQHKREWCPTCSGHVSQMQQVPDSKGIPFGKRRPHVPEDTLSGVCQCAKAYEMAIASIDYEPDEPAWKGVPVTCWRKTDV